MVRNTRYVLVSLINEDRPGVLKYTHMCVYDTIIDSKSQYKPPSQYNSTNSFVPSLA